MKKREAVIKTLIRITSAELDLDPFMQLTVKAAQKLTHATSAVIEMVDGNDMVYRSITDDLAKFVGLRLNRQASLSGQCVQERRVLKCDDTEYDPRVDREACRKIGIRSMICTPLFQQRDAIGVLKVMAAEAFKFNDDDVQTLQLIAGILGAAFSKQLMFDAKLRAEQKLRENQGNLAWSEKRLRALLLHANDAVVSIDSTGTILVWNVASEHLFGWKAAEAIGKDVVTLLAPPKFQSRYRAALAQLAEAEQLHDNQKKTQRRIELHALHQLGHHLHVELSLAIVKHENHFELLGFVHDISERKRHHEKLRQHAMQDSLTGIANRRSFIESVEKAIARTQHSGSRFALIYLDLNDFKKINDVYGHQAGDRVLCEFTQRLLSSVRRSDVVARLGGDEFVVLGEAITSLDDANVLIEKIRQSLAVPFSDPPFDFRASIGISLYEGQKSADEWLHQADVDMYKDKARKKSAA